MDTVDTKNCFEPEDGEKIIEIELERLRTFRNHPFKVRMDDEMVRLMESIKKYGIITPLVVRPIPEGAYEIIAGHRRKAAAEKLGYQQPHAEKFIIIMDILMSDAEEEDDPFEGNEFMTS